MITDVTTKAVTMVAYIHAFSDSDHVDTPISVASQWRDLAEIAGWFAANAAELSVVEFARALAGMAGDGAAIEDRLFRAGVPFAFRHVRLERKRHVRRLIRVVDGWEPGFKFAGGFSRYGVTARRTARLAA